MQMDIQQALFELGVRADTLTDGEKAALDRDGFLRLDAVLNAAQVSAMTARLDALVAEEGDRAGTEVHQEAGTDRLSDLVNKDPMFEVCFTHPRVLAGIAHVLKGNLKLSSLNARVALPGQGLQALHADWAGAVTPGDFYVCNSIWLLDDFTPTNGPTRVVPGTHNSGRTPKQDRAVSTAAHPDEVRVLAPAGTVVILNSHVWHGGTLNIGTSRRRALHSYFCRRDQQQQLDQRKYARPAVMARLSAAARTVLDVV